MTGVELILVVIAVICSFLAGLGLGWYGTSMKMWSLESKFRHLANSMHEYGTLSREETVPMEWVQDQLDTFIRQEFRG